MSVISLDEWRKKQEKLSKLTSPSAQNIPWAELGLTRIEQTNHMEDFILTYTTLDRAWRKPFTVSSKFAREGAFYVALCASEGWITTKIDEETYGNRWNISEFGMGVKKELNHVLRDLIGTFQKPEGDRPHN